MSRTNIVYSYSHRYLILPSALAASHYLTLSTNLSTIREFRHLYYILSGILTRLYLRITR